MSDRKEPVILVIDDDPNNMTIVTGYLAEREYTILVAEDGESGVSRAKYARPDLVLLDVMMPGIDGYETCRRLKALEATRDIPVVFMTALAETDHKVKGFEAGGVDYITKPFQREEVLARVGVHLRIRELTLSLEKRVEERTMDLAIANQELEDEIAERQVAQEELQAQAVVLEEKIEELQRTQNALRQSQKMEAIGTLAGGIAHDFNNILTAIIGYTEMAQSKIGFDDDSVVRSLERVQEASIRAKDLVSRILTFSRQSEQERKPVQLTAIIDEVLHLLRSSLPTTIDITRHITTAAKADMVLADPTQIHQVLMNLSTNAAHAMRVHGGVLDVSLSNFDVDEVFAAQHPDIMPGSFVRLSVSDTGCGMDPCVRDRIFDPYFTTKKVGEGTGMGLSVVHGIVKSYGGEICVYSELSKGTTFHILLPKFDGEHEEQCPDVELSVGGTERILFVDDEVMLSELGQELLGSLGYTVRRSSGSRDALNIFRADPQAFDLVITDMTMPGLTGKELARELLTIRPDIPIVICTGFSEHINEQQAKDTGIRGYVMKPYTTSGLNKMIRTVLADGSAGV